MTLNEWRRLYPEAAAALLSTVEVVPFVSGGDSGASEAWAQQQVRLRAAEQGALLWRNNVGATMSRCPACGEKFQPVRYGLANDSAKLNAVIKSHDLIGIRPVTITLDDVGSVIGQFVSIECKRPGWRFTGTEEEEGQLRFATLIAERGGYTTFSTGDLRF